jgi:DNA-binding NarL/FixJ family response regulator
LADLNIIAISIQDTDKFREAVIQAGANVFVSKFRVIHDLVPAIQREISKLSREAEQLISKHGVDTRANSLYYEW